MNNVNINYPHPVLSATSDDYIDCHFNLIMNDGVTIEGDTIIIPVSYDLKSPGLQEMVRAERAKVILYLESVEAEYRKTFDFAKDENTLSIVINKKHLSNSVVIKGYIVSMEDSNSFVLPEHNPVYFVAGPPRIKKGNILAIATESYKIPIEVYDPLADKKSIFTIRRSADQKEDIKVDYTSDNKITIFLSNDLVEEYQLLYSAPETRTTLSTIFVLPVLIDALHLMKKYKNDIDQDIVNRKWYQVINSRLAEEKIDLDQFENMTEVANKVLPHVFKYTMDSFGTVFKELIGGQE